MINVYVIVYLTMTCVYELTVMWYWYNRQIEWRHIKHPMQQWKAEIKCRMEIDYNPKAERKPLYLKNLDAHER